MLSYVCATAERSTPTHSDSHMHTLQSLPRLHDARCGARRVCEGVNRFAPHDCGVLRRCRILAQEDRAVIAEEGRADGAGWTQPLVHAALDTRERELEGECRGIVGTECAECGHHLLLLRLALGLHHKPHQSNRRLHRLIRCADAAAETRTLVAQELLKQRHGRRMRQPLHRRDRLDEPLEDRAREGEHELLAASQRRWLGAGKVGEPVHKVEGDVRVASGGGVEQRLETAKECAWWALCLHKPAMVEAQLGLCEDDRSSLHIGQAGKARERLGVMLEHVAQRDVVVHDPGARVAALVACMLGKHRR
eukprot:5524591-Prymnesium_polylepis.3